MKTRTVQIKFSTPAFLGNAEQSGQWRTPPFKAQLRQWWRMVYFSHHSSKFSIDKMRQEEGRLFGHAGQDDGNDSTRSLVRIRLQDWSTGKMASWESLPPVQHPEVGRPMPADIYLGYGPIDIRTRKLKKNAAIQADEVNTLTIAAPDDDLPWLEQSLWLMDRYGTLGGRSRNGWGSYSLTGIDVASAPQPLQLWTDALHQDWPHAIGKDSAGALIWKTAEHNNWQSLMQQLASLKITLRTQFKFRAGKTQDPEERHWLAYPVTNHGVTNWGGSARLPNSLRFKIRALPNGKLVGIIFHVPHLPPQEFHPKVGIITGVWQKVHAYLDDPSLFNFKLTRAPE